MKLISPFTILNQNFHEMDVIRNAIKNRRLATERWLMITEKFIKIISLLRLSTRNRVPVENPTFTNSIMVLL